MSIGWFIISFVTCLLIRENSLVYIIIYAVGTADSTIRHIESDDQLSIDLGRSRSNESYHTKSFSQSRSDVMSVWTITRFVCIYSQYHSSTSIVYFNLWARLMMHGRSCWAIRSVGISSILILAIIIIEFSPSKSNCYSSFNDKNSVNWCIGTCCKSFKLPLDVAF